MSVSQTDARGFRSLVRNAVIWRSGSQIVGQLVTWVSTFLVLRILQPSDYGLYAMAAVVMSFLGLVNGYGLANALVQREQVSRFELRQMFGMLVAVSVVLAGIQLAIAPAIADFYGEPQVTNLLRVMALVFLTNPFLALGYTILARDMDFKRQAQINISSSILGASVALGGALAGLGVWTLVFAPLSAFIARGIGMMVMARAFFWPSFNFRGTRAMAGFGGTVTLTSLLYFLQTQTDVVIAGREFDAATVGLYTTALFLAQIFVNKVVPPLNEVAFTALARVQSDRTAFANGFLVSVRGIMLLAVPFCIGLAVTADPLVHVLLGEKWAGTIPLVRILGLAMPWMVLQVLFAPATNAVGRPGIALQNSLTGAVLMPIAFLIGVRWGIEGMAAAWLIAYPVIAIITAIRSIPAISVAPHRLVSAIFAPAMAGLAMAIVVTLVARRVAFANPAVELAALVAIGALVYIGWLALFARDRLAELSGFIRNR